VDKYKIVGWLMCFDGTWESDVTSVI